MAALPRSFGADVTDCIMRFAVGYPRDRVRDIVSDIERIEHHDGASSLIEWRYNGTRPVWVLSSSTCRDSFIRWKLLDEARVKYFGDFCDACEPEELQQHRTRF